MSRRSRVVGSAVGRSLDLLGVALFALLAVCPVLGLAWVVFRLGGAESSETLQRLAIAVSAIAAIAGIVLIRVTRANLRSIRNAAKPRELTWRQYEVSERVLARVGRVCVVIGLAGIALAVPGHLY